MKHDQDRSRDRRRNVAAQPQRFGRLAIAQHGEAFADTFFKFLDVQKAHVGTFLRAA